MAEAVVLVAEKREGRGSQASRRLRRQGKIPGVVYGHQEATVMVALSADELHAIIRHKVHVVDLKTDGSVEKAFIKEIQWDHLGQDILHVDFARVSEDERITLPVPIEIRGTAPGVNAGGALTQLLHRVQVECLAVAVPESIRVNINELQIGQAIHVRDLHLPEGVKVLADPDAIVIQVSTPQAEPEVAAAPVAETAEPEVIGRKEKGEEEEGE